MKPMVKTPVWLHFYFDVINKKEIKNDSGTKTRNK